jgi:hypothetical protein
MHVLNRRARRRLMRRCAYQMAKPSVRTVMLAAGISAAGSLLYFALRKRHY